MAAGPDLVVAKAPQATDSVVPAPEDAPAAAAPEDATPADASTPFDEPEVVTTEPEEYVPPETPVVAVPPPRPPPPAVPGGLRAGEFGRQRAMSSVKRQTSLPDVVNIAIGYRNEDGTKFPWWYNVTDGRGAPNAAQTAGPESVDPILYNPVLENPDYDVAWYQRYFVNYGACRCAPRPKVERVTEALNNPPWHGRRSLVDDRAPHLFGPARRAGPVLPDGRQGRRAAAGSHEEGRARGPHEPAGADAVQPAARDAVAQDCTGRWRMGAAPFVRCSPCW